MTTALLRRVRVSDARELKRNIVAMPIATFLLALGENIWKRFLPRRSRYAPPIPTAGWWNRQMLPLAR